MAPCIILPPPQHWFTIRKVSNLPSPGAHNLLTDSPTHEWIAIYKSVFTTNLSLGELVVFSNASTGSVNHTVTSISSPTPYGPRLDGLVEVMFFTRGTSVDTTMSRLAPREQPLNVTHVPGSGRLTLIAVAPYEEGSRVPAILLAIGLSTVVYKNNRAKYTLNAAIAKILTARCKRLSDRYANFGMYGTTSITCVEKRN